ncbi:MAG: aldo/keto reductase [Planctomycetes bacterium]|nr:aldo/keto reductase [Planctomycetota bacterium]
MSNVLNWGIIGTGAIASAFARAVANSKTGKVVAVGSRTKEASDKFAGQFNIPNRHGSYQALLNDPQVQAVYISTPHPMHPEWAIKAAEAGKHILCEKPMSLNAADTMAMFEAAVRHNVFCMEAFMYRCHPQTAKLVELLKEKAIGDVRVVVASFGFGAGYSPTSRIWANELGGGGIMDVGCYAVSMSRLVAAAATGVAVAEPTDVKASGVLAPTGVDSYAAAVLTFPGDIIAEVSTGVGVGLENVVRIFGTGGSIFIPNPWTADRQNGGEFHIFVNRHGKPQEDIVIRTEVTAFTIEADVVARAVAEGKKQPPFPAMTWDDTLANLRTLDRWRAGVGVVFNEEKPGAKSVTVANRPLAVAADNKMKYGEIVGVNKPVARLVLGVDNQMFYPHAYVMFDDYFERGGNSFDTGYIYGGGVLERHLGSWIKSRGLREKVVVLSKGAHTPHCNPDAIRSQHAESLERLQTDYVDVYMMHRDNPEIPVGEFIDVLNELKAKGSIRAFGGSNWSLERVKKANAYAKRKGLTGFTAISNNFSLARMVDAVWGGCIAASDPEYRKWLKKSQLALMPWSSQARGFFLPHVHPGYTADKELSRCWFSEDNFQRRERAVELAKKRGVEPINIALAYVLAQPFPTFPLIGPRTLAETRSSFRALEVDLSAREVKWLNLEA